GRRGRHDGVLPWPARAPIGARPAAPPRNDDPAPEGLELTLYRCPKVHDGRFANNAWLQELPEFTTKLTWGNALLVAPRTAAELGLAQEDVVLVEHGDASTKATVHVAPGQARGSLALALGYGRVRAGVVGGSAAEGVEPVGDDATPLRRGPELLVAGGVRVTRTGARATLAATQEHHLIDAVGMEGREARLGDLVREGTLAEYLDHPDFAQHAVHHPPLESLWKEHEYDEGHRWGMAIDLGSCTGCNACVVACQAENNIPVVGKDEVRRGREMHWIRMDVYYAGEPDDPRATTQPVACQHCENAPCEQVCPVAATVHSSEGLNDMVYNRCIGTRYCANNCPYKVRRFNFFDYNAELEGEENELLRLGKNPEVTVRSRGVMEKCTFCVQRIQTTRAEARREGRELGRDEVRTACQQVCPTRAITFGDLNDSESLVARRHASPRSYELLGELNVKPRTAYLARVTNPSPALEAPAEHDDRHSHDG
ncbi:MAG: 4Fe-4S dicluster domain-containing protein, partial [Planctomycetota bacterium]